jgi:hypothetical protein
LLSVFHSQFSHKHPSCVCVHSFPALELSLVSLVVPRPWLWTLNNLRCKFWTYQVAYNLLLHLLSCFSWIHVHAQMDVHIYCKFCIYEMPRPCRCKWPGRFSDLSRDLGALVFDRTEWVLGLMWSERDNPLIFIFPNAGIHCFKCRGQKPWREIQEFR